MPAAAAASQLGADDRDHFDALLAQQRIGVGVAVVGDDDAGREGDVVVAAVPLLSFGGVCVAAGLNDAELLESESFGDDVDERLVSSRHFDSRWTGRRAR